MGAMPAARPRRARLALLAVGAILPVVVSPVVPAVAADGSPVTVSHDTAAPGPLSLDVAADPGTVTAAGQVVAFTFTVTDTGSAAVTDLAIDDSLGSTGLAASAITCVTDSLAPGDHTTCTGNYAVTQADIDAGKLHNVSRGTATATGGAAVQSRRAPLDVAVTQAPAVAVATTTSVAAVTDIGQHVSYSFTVTNTGNTTLRQVAVTAVLTAPAGPGLAPTCPRTKLLPGQQVTCTADYPATAADFDTGTIKSSVTASGVAPDQSTVTSTPSTATVTTTAAPAITIAKHAALTDVDSNGAIGVGDTIGWTFTVTNSGNVSLHGIQVRDAKAGSVTCPTAPLAADDAETCTADDPYAITQADVDAGHVANTATASGTDPFGHKRTSAASRIDTSITTTAELTLAEAVAPKQVAAVGDTVTYTFTVTNGGDVTITHLSVDDVLAAPATTKPGAVT